MPNQRRKSRRDQGKRRRREHRRQAGRGGPPTDDHDSGRRAPIRATDFDVAETPEDPGQIQPWLEARGYGALLSEPVAWTLDLLHEDDALDGFLFADETTMAGCCAPSWPAEKGCPTTRGSCSRTQSSGS